MEFQTYKQAFLHEQPWTEAQKNYTVQEGLEFAVRRAYNDMMPRTIHGIGKVDDAEKDALKKALADEIRRKFIDDVPTSCDVFDKRHKEVCEDFLEKLNALCTKYDLKEQHYGKAQKIVNMTFKYLLLFDKTGQYTKLFEYCHMPIDTYVLAYFQDKYKGTQAAGAFDIPAWSNMQEGEYACAQKQIKAYCASLSNEFRYPLYVEFRIWNEGKAIYINSKGKRKKKK